ncbi:GUN4 domain-containing protein [Synechocystis sp. B12]|nr:GUN4 domain-containing protein [Synechocystis sp. B12]
MADSITPDSNEHNYAELAQQCQNLASQVQSLSQRVENLESKLTLIPDIERYGRLQECLIAGDFKTADHETTRIILETLNRNRDNLSPETLSALPCTVLTVIDRLWRTYSEDRFGFSRQLEAYQKVGGNTDTLRTQDRKVMGPLPRKWVGCRKERFVLMSMTNGIFPSMLRWVVSLPFGGSLPMV